MRLHRDAKVELIRTIPLFAGCDAHELERVAAVADEIDLPAGRRLTTENADGREFVVIVEGAAQVSRGGDVVATVGPGSFVGEISLVTGQPRTATVVATTPVHALVIEGHLFQRLLEEAPDLRAKVQQAAEQRLHHEPDPSGV